MPRRVLRHLMERVGEGLIEIVSLFPAPYVAIGALGREGQEYQGSSCCFYEGHESFLSWRQHVRVHLQPNSLLEIS